jgi:hypothetical protein
VPSSPLRSTLAIILAAVTCNIFCSLSAKADVSLPSVFSDHMVLQRDQPINLWGKADPGETIRIEVGKQSRTTVARKSGDWSITLDPMHSPGSCEISIGGKNRLSIRDVQLGMSGCFPDNPTYCGRSNIPIAPRKILEIPINLNSGFTNHQGNGKLSQSAI